MIIWWTPCETHRIDLILEDINKSSVFFRSWILAFMNNKELIHVIVIRFATCTGVRAKKVFLLCFFQTMKILSQNKTNFVQARRLYHLTDTSANILFIVSNMFFILCACWKRLIKKLDLSWSIDIDKCHREKYD